MHYCLHGGDSVRWRLFKRKNPYVSRTKTLELNDLISFTSTESHRQDYTAATKQPRTISTHHYGLKSPCSSLPFHCNSSNSLQSTGSKVEVDLK